MRSRWLGGLAWVLVLSPALWAQGSDKTRLVGVGSTFPLRAYTLWIQEFGKTRPDIQVSYMPFGSMQGSEMVASDAADFGGSEIPLAPSGAHVRKLLFFPVALGAIVPIYNVSGLSKPLRFTPQALAGIYLGKIIRWDDPALTLANPDVALPSIDIVVIHTAEGRGSTYIWSDYLSKVSPEWRTRVGRGIAPHWPVGGEADGNGNVAKAVRETPNSIAYVELEYAKQAGLLYGKVQNAAGKFVSASEESTAAAASAAVKSLPEDFRCSITNPSGEASYPIASFTWLVIPASDPSAQKQQAAKDFVRWVLNEGQEDMNATGLVRLPEELVKKELRAVDKIQ